MNDPTPTLATSSANTACRSRTSVSQGVPLRRRPTRMPAAATTNATLVTALAGWSRNPARYGSQPAANSIQPSMNHACGPIGSTYKRIVRQLVITRAGDGNRTRTVSSERARWAGSFGVNHPAITAVLDELASEVCLAVDAGGDRPQKSSGQARAIGSDRR